MNALVRALAKTLSLGSPPVTPAERMRHLVAQLAGQEPANAIRKLVDELPLIVSCESQPERQLELLDIARNAASDLLPGIEREIEIAPLPLSRLLIVDALSADNLLKAIAGEYQKVVFRLLPALADPAGAALSRATLHAARLLLRRQHLAGRAGKAASASTWRRLHRIFRLARDRGYADFADASGSIESCYLGAVLLFLADPFRSPRADFVATLDTIQRLAPQAHLHDVESGEPRDNKRFLGVNPQDHRPGFVSPDTAAPGASWRIDLEPLIECLQTEIRAIEVTLTSQRVTAAPRRVLIRLLECWRRQPVRQFTRQSMRPSVDVVTGLDHLWWALSYPSPIRRSANAAENPDPKALEWVVVDESAAGFGLCQVRGIRPDIDVGDIVGVGLRDIGRLHLCIVRRIKEDRRLRCHIGVQHLSPDAAAVVLVGERLGRQEQAIRLSCLPAMGGRVGMVVQAGKLVPGAVAHELGASPAGEIRIGQAIEHNARHALHLVECLTA